jgi:HEPN domain-containing protein
LAGARLLAANSNRNSVYLCEQAAEKVIRAVATSEGIHAGIKHDLAEVVDSIPDANPLKTTLRSIEHLSQYATAYRYPVSSSRGKRIPRSPAGPELQKALDDTEAALQAVAASFKVELARSDEPAGGKGPIR